MLRILLLTLVFWGLYRFVVRFVMPLLRITGAVRKQMQNMQSSQPTHHAAPSNSSKARKGDYIDFEEVRQ